MTAPRLRADLWVKAHIRRCFAVDIPAMLRHRGDAERGSVLLKINRFEAGCELLSPMLDMEGRREWVRLTGDEPATDARAEEMIAKRLRLDPDLWLVEIEDADGRHELDDPIR